MIDRSGTASEEVSYSSRVWGWGDLLFTKTSCTLGILNHVHLSPSQNKMNKVNKTKQNTGTADQSDGPHVLSTTNTYVTDTSLPGRHQGGHVYQWTPKQIWTGSSPASFASEGNGTHKEKEHRKTKTHIIRVPLRKPYASGGIWKFVLATNPRAQFGKPLNLRHFTSQLQPSARPVDCAKLGLLPGGNSGIVNMPTSEIAAFHHMQHFLLFTSSFSIHSRLSRLAVMSSVCELTTLNIQVVEPTIVLKAPSLQYRGPGTGSWCGYHTAAGQCCPSDRLSTLYNMCASFNPRWFLFI